MPPRSKRPLSVWIAQIILGIYAFGTVLIVLWGLYNGLTKGIPNPQLYILTTVGIVTFAAIFFGGVWGMAIRKPWGRWMGVAGLAVLLIAAAVEQTSRWLSGIGEESGPVSISLFFRVLLVLGLAFLAYKLAAGDVAEEFFNGRSTKFQRELARIRTLQNSS